MLAYNIKDILTIVPEAQELIKQANIEEEFPLGNKDGCIASYLRAYYLVKVAGKPVDAEVMDKLEKAARLYGIKEIVKPFLQTMKKFAEIKKSNALEQAERISVKVAEANFEGSLSGLNFNPLQAMHDAKALMDKYASEITSTEVKRYSGQIPFIKYAALEALEARATASGNDVYNKIAGLVDKHMEIGAPANEVLNLYEKVIELDKKAGLVAKGLNFIKEATSADPFRTNGALTLKVAGKVYPYEKFERLGKHRIGQYIGKDVASELTNDPQLNKRIIESLPLDLQRVLATMFRSV